MKNFGFYFLVISLSFVSIVSGYFIVVNTLIKNDKNTSIRIDEYNVSFASETELNDFLSSEIYQNLPEKIDITFGEYSYSMTIAELDFYVETYNLSDSQEKNILESIKEGMNSDSKEREVNYNINIDNVIKKFPINIQSTNPARIENGVLKNCENNEYFLEIDRYKLERKILNSIIRKIPINEPIENILTFPTQGEIIKYCNQYLDQVEFLDDFSTKINKQNPNQVLEIFEFYVFEGQGAWRIKNIDNLRNLIEQSKSLNNANPYEGEYIIEDSTIYIFRDPVNGRRLNTESTITNVYSWLNNPNEKLEISFDSIIPQINSDSRAKIDFTKLVSVGRSRIDIMRDGRPNWSLPYAQAGLEEVDFHVVWPKEEFSFIKTIKPQPNGNTADGRAIGGGICNSTTTIFRAALESGFPITDRSSHTWNVDSYAWGYEHNMVDAAYYTSPKVDFKFVNDFDYPIIMRFEIEMKNDGFQYHNIYIYSSKNVPSREVEITNWRKWNIRSDKLFDGAFDRIVKQNGQILRQDTFESRYRDSGWEG